VSFVRIIEGKLSGPVLTIYEEPEICWVV